MERKESDLTQSKPQKKGSNPTNPLQLLYRGLCVSIGVKEALELYQQSLLDRKNDWCDEITVTSQNK